MKAHGEQTFVYDKVSGATKITTTYTLKKTDNLITINSINKDQKTEALSSSSRQLASFSCAYTKNNDHSLFTLKNGALTAEGMIKGESLKEVYQIKESLWVQEFEFGLYPFLISDKSSWSFSILHPKNFKLHKMIAKKHGKETIKIDDKSYKALVIHITLPGFKSMFWKAELWYDIETNNLLMYKSNEGPNTPSVAITLVSNPAKID
jgi:hypothetical protein